ncbi:hypothetical protein FHS27_001234 [Rhodopirellula rubra]|uniref:Uncharacterized protein n=1 Tax=Aporhodopirellula rubra TaxID=980271 RepID=A0A7W5H4K4_9BACT|nr:hypothetical protein [Aporhodopirellula rubra]MBB3205434.1 hypothetical protein [Aporhodopirellula rubra]
MANATETKTKTPETTIRAELAKLEWMIPDAKRDLAKAAERLAARGIAAVKECHAMIADEPCSMGWTEFAEQDARHASEAKAKLTALFEHRQLLQYLIDEND